MTVSEHTYTAVLDVLPGSPLSVVGGQVSFDSGRSPHVQGTLTIPASAAVLDVLDPRDSIRVQLTADAVFPDAVQHRVFDLGVRSRRVSAEDGTVEIGVASDEAIVAAVRTLADDVSPLSHQDSLHDLVDAVLDEVIPGAALDRPGSAADVAVPALASSSNLIRNPRAGVNLTDWSSTWAAGGLSMTRQTSGGPAYAPTYAATQATGATTGGYIYLDNAAISITPGRLYALSVAVHANAGIQLSVDAILYDQSGNIVAFAQPAVVTPGPVWTRVRVEFVAVTNAAQVRPRVNIDGSMPGGQYVNVTGWRLSEATGDTVDDGTYWDGDTADTALYDYSWAQGAHASISNRKPKIDAATPDALTWRAGVSGMDFLRPIVQRFGLRLVCDEQRVWTLRDEDYTAAGSLTIRHGVNLTGGEDTIDRDDSDWCDARVTRYTWTTPDGAQMQAVDSFALVDPPTQVSYLELNTPYPGPGRSEYAVRRAQQRGRQITASKVADWGASAEQPLTIRLDGTPAQTGKTQTVTFDLDTDEVTVTSRTTDTPERAWILQAAQPWTAGPVGESWTEAHNG